MGVRNWNVDRQKSFCLPVNYLNIEPFGVNFPDSNIFNILK